MIKKIFKMGVCSSLIITGLYSASFNCKKASTFIEKTICSDAKLSKLDEELASAYKKIWHSLSDRTELKKDQLNWLKNDRNRSTSLEDLKASYVDRILYLTNYNRSSQINKSSSSVIQGTFVKGNADIKINQNLSFNYTSVNDSNGNLCMIEDEKFKVVNNNLVWNSNDYDCKISILFLDKNSVDLSLTGDECNFYCGHNAYINEGIYKQEDINKTKENAREESKEKLRYTSNDSNNIISVADFILDFDSLEEKYVCVKGNILSFSEMVFLKDLENSTIQASLDIDDLPRNIRKAIITKCGAMSNCIQSVCGTPKEINYEKGIKVIKIK